MKRPPWGAGRALPGVPPGKVLSPPFPTSHQSCRVGEMPTDPVSVRLCSGRNRHDPVVSPDPSSPMKAKTLVGTPTICVGAESTNHIYGSSEMTRIYERQTDALFAAAFSGNPDFARVFLTAIDGRPDNQFITVSRQTPHRGEGHSGSIDLEITRADGSILLIENKIDACYSVTRKGDPQPDRYRASVAALLRQGRRAGSVLLAPQVYLRGTRHGFAFDHQVSYEALCQSLRGADLALMEAAILQAATPYDPIPNPSSAAFFADYHTFARKYFPELAIKQNPNGNGVRPTESRTIYFDVPRTLRAWPALPRPRMSLQCRDSTAPSASVKIMLGDWGEQAKGCKVPDSLQALGGYVRPAGQSLGLVIDTPQLDTQMPLEAQVAEVEEGLEAARRLAGWWNRFADTLEVK